MLLGLRALLEQLDVVQVADGVEDVVSGPVRSSICGSIMPSQSSESPPLNDGVPRLTPPLPEHDPNVSQEAVSRGRPSASPPGLEADAHVGLWHRMSSGPLIISHVRHQLAVRFPHDRKPGLQKVPRHVQAPHCRVVRCCVDCCFGCCFISLDVCFRCFSGFRRAASHRESTPASAGNLCRFPPSRATLSFNAEVNLILVPPHADPTQRLDPPLLHQRLEIRERHAEPCRV